MQYRDTATGALYAPGAIVRGVQTHERMNDAAWDGLGCVPYTPPPPEPTTPDPAAVAHAAKRDYLRGRFAAQLAAEGVAPDASAETIAAALDAAIGELPVKQQRVFRALAAMVNLHEMGERLTD